MTYSSASSLRPAVAAAPQAPPALQREPLLRLDPELGRYLAADRRSVAESLLWTPVVDIAPGPWRNVRGLVRQTAGIGVLLLSGLVARELRIGDTPSAQLLGAGDLIRRTEFTEPGSLEPPLAWAALTPTRAALLDQRVAGAFFRYPELMMVVLDRLSVQAQRLALAQAISHLTGVDRRLEALFWQLADRWGKVTPRGVVVPLHLSHRLLGSLVGARRPTVTTALAQLAETGRVVPSPPRGWLLTGAPPVTRGQDGRSVEHHARHRFLRSVDAGAV
jgi:CRP/FNR family cyclic AMP-dependent transcriptional regulator